MVVMMVIVVVIVAVSRMALALLSAGRLALDGDH